MTDYSTRAEPTALPDASLNFGVDTLIDTLTGSAIRSVITGRSSVTGILSVRPVSVAGSGSGSGSGIGSSNIDLVALTGRMDIVEQRPIPPTITRAFGTNVSLVALDAFNQIASPKLDDIIIASQRQDATTAPERVQIWQYVGEGAASRWALISDSATQFVAQNFGTRMQTVEAESKASVDRLDVLYQNAVKHPHHEIFESPSIAGTSYTFLARDTIPLENIVSITNGQLDLDFNGNVIYLVTPWDAAGESTWIWGLLYDEPTHDPACAKFYIATVNHQQIVRYGKRRYMAGVGATITQLATPPLEGTLDVNTAGWIRQPDLPANVVQTL